MTAAPAIVLAAGAMIACTGLRGYVRAQTRAAADRGLSLLLFGAALAVGALVAAIGL